MCSVLPPLLGTISIYLFIYLYICEGERERDSPLHSADCWHHVICSVGDVKVLFIQRPCGGGRVLARGTERDKGDLRHTRAWCVNSSHWLDWITVQRGSFAVPVGLTKRSSCW